MSVAYQTPSDLAAHYKAVRARLWTKTVAAKPAPPPVKIIALPPRPVIEVPPACMDDFAPEPEMIYSSPIGPVRSDADYARIEVARIAGKHRCSEADLLSPRRQQNIVQARHELYWHLHKYTRWSMMQIGRFCDRDHTSVLHGCRQFQKRIDSGDAVFVERTDKPTFGITISLQNRAIKAPLYKSEQHDHEMELIKMQWQRRKYAAMRARLIEALV